jgi:hypothetical protein
MWKLNTILANANASASLRYALACGIFLIALLLRLLILPVVSANRKVVEVVSLNIRINSFFERSLIFLQITDACTNG